MLAIADGPRAPSASMRLASKAMSIAIAIGMVAASLLLSGCGFALFDEQQLGDDAAHTIMVAIEEDDMDALFPLLAPCALEADDLQEGFSYAHSVLDGPVVSIERHGTSYGKQVRGFIWSRSILGRYDVATESGDYLLSFEYYPPRRRPPHPRPPPTQPARHDETGNLPDLLRYRGSLHRERGVARRAASDSRGA